MKKAILLSVIVASGCSSFGQREVGMINSAIAARNCTHAYEIAGSTNDPVRYFNFAIIADSCEGQKQKAINFWNHGARLGNQNSIDQLLAMGIPVPAPDLVRQRNSSGDAALGLMFLQAGQARPAPRQQMICDTDKFGNGLQTVCR